MEQGPKFEMTERQTPEEILDILNSAIESKSEVTLTISNPPSNELRTATVFLEKIEAGRLYVATGKDKKMAIEFSRVKKAVFKNNY